MSLLLIFLMTVLVGDEVKLPGGAVDKLQRAGFKVSAKRLQHRSEGTVSKKLKDLQKQRKELAQSRGQLEDARNQLVAGEQQFQTLEQRHSQLLIEVANAVNNVQRNQMVDQANATLGQIRQLRTGMNDFEKQRDQLRADLTKREDEFLTSMTETRVLIEDIETAYASIDSSETLLESVKEIETATGNRLERAPPAGLQRSRTKIDEIGDGVVSQDIEGKLLGNTLMVQVMIGDAEEPLEMVVDSGASIISLPGDAAARLNVKIPADAPELTLSLADGRQITAYRVLLDRVRLGPFEAKKVEAAILGPEADGADPLLGMSFLGQFNFRINSAEQKLSMTDVAVEESASEGKRKKKRSKQ
jgi:clan AA aspartic protease (TIGR02281 family)